LEVAQEVTESQSGTIQSLFGNSQTVRRQR
jgi:hypothetical protein